MEHTEDSSAIKTTIQYLDAVAAELSNGYLSIFAGAGTSLGSGYVDWKQLMEPIIDQLGVNPNIDLTKAAQYYENEFGRHGINLIVNEEFHKGERGENRTLDQIIDLPVTSVWTTNYDSLLEDSYARKGKVVDVKVRQEQFKYHVPNCDVTIYKMHGDKDYPDDVIITKNDYETYDSEREVFTKALSVELITHTFLFIGFSFSDPNLDRIISIVRHIFKYRAPKNHYCFMKRVCKTDSIYNTGGQLNYEQYVQDYNYQVLRIRDMRKYGIQTILVDDFSQINDMLDYIKYKYTSNHVFVSGSYPDQLNSDSEVAEFIKLLSERLVEKRYQIFSGFGSNVGNYLVLGAYRGIQKCGLRDINKAISIYPLLSLKELDGETNRQNTEDIRASMVDACGIFISMFGKTKYVEGLTGEEIKAIFEEISGSSPSPSQKEKDTKIYVPKSKRAWEILQKLNNDGMISEYKIASQQGKIIIAYGFAEHTSKYIAEFEKIRHPLSGTADAIPLNDVSKLNSSEKRAEIVDKTIALIEKLQEKRSKQMEKNLIESIQRGKITMRKIFISFHYDDGNQIAKNVRELLRQKENYFANDEETVHTKNQASIKAWIDDKLNDTDTTVLIWTKNISKSEFVKYEIRKSIERRNAFVILADFSSGRTTAASVINQLHALHTIPFNIPNDYFVVGDQNRLTESLIPLLELAYEKRKLADSTLLRQ